MSIESRIWSRNSRSSTAPQRWMRRSASVDLPWSMWAMMQKLRIWSMGSVFREAAPLQPQVLAHAAHTNLEQARRAGSDVDHLRAHAAILLPRHLDPHLVPARLEVEQLFGAALADLDTYDSLGNRGLELHLVDEHAVDPDDQ